MIVVQESRSIKKNRDPSSPYWQTKCAIVVQKLIRGLLARRQHRKILESINFMKSAISKFIII